MNSMHSISNTGINNTLLSTSLSATAYPAQPLVLDKETECKNLQKERFTYAIFYSIAIQYILLLVFLLFVNFDLLHPINWLKSTLLILISIKTWLWTIPLISTIVLFGIFNMKPFLKERIYYRSRFSKLVQTLPQESIILFLNAWIGIFTACLYKRYLRDDYRYYLVSEEKESEVLLNERSVFLVFNGLFMGVYYFFKMRNPEQMIVFPVVHISKYAALREQLYSALYNSVFKSFVPLLNYICIYTLFSKSIFQLFGYLLTFENLDKSYFEHFTSILDVRLLFYSWILSSQILGNMHLMSQITNILSTEPKDFPIDEKNELNLTDALSYGKYQITEQLAALDLFMLSEKTVSHRRKLFYALSIPGGHPNNWKRLVNLILTKVDNYSDDLTKSLEKISANKANNNNLGRIDFSQPILQSEIADKLFIRQYNERFGIRSMIHNEPNGTSTLQANGEKPKVSAITEKVNALKYKILSNPLISCIFGETHNRKLCFLLTHHSQTIIWITQGLSAIVANSIEEDSYGVVQNDIKRILKSFIKLKTVLDRIVAINIGVKKIDDLNYAALKSAVKRSLYRITHKFVKYFDDLMLDPEDLRALQSFINFKEL